jgi:hypothetical protein
MCKSSTAYWPPATGCAKARVSQSDTLFLVSALSSLDAAHTQRTVSRLEGFCSLFGSPLRRPSVDSVCLLLHNVHRDVRALPLTI